MQLAALSQLVQCHRDAGSTGVAVAIHVFVELCTVGVQRLDAVVDDAAVGLMADHPVQIVQRKAGLVQYVVQTFGQGIHRKAEHRPAVHADGCRACAAGAAGMDGGIAPGTQRDGKGHGGVGQFKHRRTGTIAEQHTGGTVGGIHQAGERLCADDQRILPAQRSQQAARHRRAIQKAGACGVHVQCRAVFRQRQRRLHLTGHAWGGIRRGKGGADAAGNVCRGKAAALQRLLCGGNGQCGGVFALGAVVPSADASAGGDPLVAGIHGAAQLFVGDRAAGQSPAGGDQTQTLHAFLISPI